MADLYYIESGYFTPDNYYVYIADAASAVNSSLTLTAAVGVIKESSIVLTSATSQTSDAETIKQAAADVGALFTPNVDAGAVINRTAVLDSVSSLSADTVVIRDYASSLSSNISITSDAAVFKESSVSVNSSFGQETQISRTREFDSAISAEFTFVVESGQAELAQADLSSTSAFTVDAVANRSADIAQATVVTLSSQGDRIRYADSSQSSSISISSSVEKISDATSTLAAAFTQDTIPERIQQANIDVSSLFTPTLDVNVFKNSFAVLESSITLTASIDKTADFNISQTAQTSLSADISLGKEFQIAATSESSVTAIITKIIQGNSTISSAFAPTLTVLVFRNQTAALSTTASMSITGSVIRSAQSSISATNTLSSIVRKISGGSANLSGAFSPSITANIDYNFYFRYYTAPQLDPDTGWTFNYVSISDVLIDSNDNVYLKSLVSYTNGSTYDYSTELVKVDRYGNITFRRRYKNSTYNDAVFNDYTVIGPDDYIYTETYRGIAKVDPSNGNIIWNKTYAGSSSGVMNTSAFFDNAGDLYTANNIVSTNDLRIIKWNKTDGSIVYRKKITGAIRPDNRLAPVFDSQGYLYLVTDQVSGQFTLCKIDLTNNSILWQKECAPYSGGSNNPFGLCVDRDDNVYISYADRLNSTTSRNALAKFNSSGTFQWAKYSPTLIPAFGLTYDENTNRIYATANGQTLSDDIIAYDTNGNIVWQTRASYTSNYTGFSLGEDVYYSPSRSALYLIAFKTQSGDTTSGFAKIPLPGSGTGTTADSFSYGSVTASSFTSTTSEATAGFFTGSLSSSLTTDTSSLIISTNPTIAEKTEVVISSEIVPVTGGSFWQIAQANLTATSSVNAQAIRTKGTSAALSAIGSISITANASKILTANTNSQFNIVVNSSVIRRADAQVSVVFSQTTDVRRLRNIQSIQNVVSNISAQAQATKSAISSIIGQANITADNSRTRAVGISTDSVASQLSAVAKIGDFLIAFDANITSSVQAVKTTDTVSNISAQSTLSAQAVKTTDITDQLASDLTLTTNFDRSRSTTVDIGSTATLSSNINYSVDAISSLTSNFALLAETSGIIRANANLVAPSAVTATITRNRFADGNLSTTVTLTVDAITVLQYAADLNSSLSTVIDNSRTRDTVVQTDSIATQLSAVAKTGQGFITLDAPVTLTISAVKTADISSNLIAQTNSESIIGSIKQANISLTATLSLNADGVVGVIGESYNTVTASISITATKTTDITSNNQINSTVSASAVRTRRIGIDMFASGGQLIEGIRIKFAQANISINTTLTCLGGVNLVILNQTLFNNISLTASVRSIHIDPYLTWMVDEESRSYKIKEETRLRGIAEETRTYIIEGA